MVTGRNNRVELDSDGEDGEEENDEDGVIVVRKLLIPECIVCTGFEVIMVVEGEKVGLEASFWDCWGLASNNLEANLNRKKESNTAHCFP